MVKISGSLLSAKDNLLATLNEFNNLNIDYIHLDIMDNIFVSHSSFSDDEIRTIIEMSNKKFDVHLMVSNPAEYLYSYRSINTESITVHYEALKSYEIIDKIKKKNIKVGLSIKPNTKLEEIYDLLPKIDIVLIMSVEPGEGGQEFIIETNNKIKTLKSKIRELGLNVLISVDGGINENNYKECINAGVDILVIGSSLVYNNNKSEYVNLMKNIDT